MTMSVGPTSAVLAVGLFAVLPACQSKQDSGPPPDCLIGTWRESPHTWLDDGVSWTGKGVVQRFSADGTRSLDYSDGFRLSATIDNQQWTSVIAPTKAWSSTATAKPAAAPGWRSAACSGARSSAIPRWGSPPTRSPATAMR